MKRAHKCRRGLTKNARQHHLLCGQTAVRTEPAKSGLVSIDSLMQNHASRDWRQDVGFQLTHDVHCANTNSQEQCNRKTGRKTSSGGFKIIRMDTIANCGATLLPLSSKIAWPRPIFRFSRPCENSTLTPGVSRPETDARCSHTMYVCTS